jgi:hypothetical protein
MSVELERDNNYMNKIRIYYVGPNESILFQVTQHAEMYDMTQKVHIEVYFDS